MEGAVVPAVPCCTKVSHRKAPGAMSAMAFIVRPVRPRVGFMVTSDLSAIGNSPGLPDTCAVAKFHRKW